MRSHLRHVPKDISRNRGFSLIELMVAMAIFLLVSASVFTLFSHQQTNANQQQGLVGLNIGIRNVISQLQLDLANAGTGYYIGPNIPTWPIGVTILNNVVSAGTSCYQAATNTYTTNCFDQLNILTAANSTSAYPPINATDSSGGTSGTLNCSQTSNGYAYGQAAAGLTLAATAANYSQGDQLLLLHNSSKGSYMTAVKLTQAPVPVGSAIKFTFNPTNSDGTNTGPNWQTNDPLDITACENNQNTGSCPSPNNFGNQFCGGDWILKVFPISYYVDSSNSNDPQLIRMQGGNKVAVMDQVIGFKLGAAIWNSINNGPWGTSYYFYDASKYNINNPINPVTGYAYNPDSPYLFSLVRSLRVSLIARTQPSTDPSFTFRNAFDNGPYIVQGASVVVNPRNLSMNE